MSRRKRTGTASANPVRPDVDAENAALIGEAAVAAVADIVARAQREMPLNEGSLRQELRALLRPVPTARPDTAA